MDSIDMNIQTIISLDPGLQKAFVSLVEQIEHRNEKIPNLKNLKNRKNRKNRKNLKKELHDAFTMILIDRIETAKCIKRFIPTAQFDIAHIVFEKEMWIKAFNSMAIKINVQLMELYYNLNFAISNLCVIATKFDDYMYNFVQANKCSYDSEMYKAKYHELTKWVSARFEKIIGDVKETYEDEDYENSYNYESCAHFELSSIFLREVTEIWLFVLDEYISDENIRFDNSNVSFYIGIDEKEQKRISYEHRKKNSHSHNKRRKTIK